MYCLEMFLIEQFVFVYSIRNMFVISMLVVLSQAASIELDTKRSPTPIDNKNMRLELEKMESAAGGLSKIWAVMKRADQPGFDVKSLESEANEKSKFLKPLEESIHKLKSLCESCKFPAVQCERALHFVNLYFKNKYYIGIIKICSESHRFKANIASFRESNRFDQTTVTELTQELQSMQSELRNLEDTKMDGHLMELAKVTLTTARFALKKYQEAVSAIQEPKASVQAHDK